MDDTVKANIYKKFGIFLNEPKSTPDNSKSNVTAEHTPKNLAIWQHTNDSAQKLDSSNQSDVIEYSINETVLLQNLNQGLFAELHTLTLKELNEAFEKFKKTDSFNILREDINRQVKLYEVMYEAKLVSSL